MKTVQFKSDNLTLDANLFYPPQKQDKYPGLMFIHGWLSNKGNYINFAEQVADLGFVVLIFDLRGQGKSEGDYKKYTRKEYLTDSLAAYDFLASQFEVDISNITSVGSSFGGFLTVLLSSKRNLKNIGLRVPADYPNEGFDTESNYEYWKSYRKLIWREKPKDPTDTMALSALHDFSGNILIVESENDDMVPRQTLQNYANAVRDKSKLTYSVIKDAPHSLKTPKERAEFGRILVEWLEKVK